MLKENNIQENVLKKIHAGNVSMHSRTYFILRTSIIILMALSVLTLSFFALSFVFFNVHESGTQFLLEFNNQGLVTFITLFPWTILLCALAFLIVLEIVLRTFAFGYQAPLLRTFLWILVVGIIGSSLLSLTPLHSTLLTEADNDQLPVLGPLYKQVHGSHREQGVYRGVIISITDSEFVISHKETDRDSDDGSWTIHPPVGFDFSTLIIGERVYVAGRLQGNTVYAYGIHHIQNSK